MQSKYIQGGPKIPVKNETAGRGDIHKPKLNRNMGPEMIFFLIKKKKGLIPLPPHYFDLTCLIFFSFGVILKAFVTSADDRNPPGF